MSNKTRAAMVKAAPNRWFTFCILTLSGGTVIGALLKVEMVWTIQDIALALLTIPNLIAMVVLFPKARKATKELFSAPELYEGARR